MIARHTLGSRHVWLLLSLTLIVVLFSIVPLGRLFIEAFNVRQDTGLTPMEAAIMRRSTWTATLNSLYTSGLGTLISLILGAGFAFIISLTNVRFKAALVFAFMLPMMIPPQVTALAWLQMTGPSSALLRALDMAPALGTPNPLYSANGIALLLGVQHAPMVFLALRASLLALPKEAVEAARLSGASQARTWFDVVLPLSSPGLIAGTAIAFVSAIGNFGIPAFLGIPANYYVLPTLIYQRMANFGTNIIGEVAALSIIIAAIAIAGIAVQYLILKRRDYRLIGLASSSLAFKLGWKRPILETSLWVTLAVILLAPLLALVAASLVPAVGVRLTADTASLRAYYEVLFRQQATIRGISNSLFLATSAALILLLIAGPFGYFLARQKGNALRFLAALTEVPYALPGVVLAIACILIFIRPLPFVDVTLYGTIWVILFAYLARFMTISIKPVQSSFEQMDPALEEAAQLSGASFLRRVIDIMLPLAAPAAAAGCLLVFLISVNELTVSALLWTAGRETIGVMIMNLNDSGENAMASALSFVVVLMVLVLMLALELISRFLPKGVVPWHN